MNDIMFQIHDKIKSNPNILKLLFYMNNEIDPTVQPNLTLTQAKQIAKNNIYTRKKIPKENETIQAYISMRFGQKIYHHEKNQFFNGNTFNFYVLCHNDFDSNEIIGSRVAAIEEYIAGMFDEGEVGTTCKTRVSRSVDIDVNGADYSGRHIEIVFSDFNIKDKITGGY